MATKATSKLKLSGMPGELVLSSIGSGGNTAAKSGADSDKDSGKHSIVHKLVVNGQEVDILFRIETTARGLFVDVVADSSIANLSTTVAGLTFTSPSTAKDVVDTQALLAAGGS